VTSYIHPKTKRRKLKIASAVENSHLRRRGSADTKKKRRKDKKMQSLDQKLTRKQTMLTLLPFEALIRAPIPESRPLAPLDAPFHSSSAAFTALEVH
jgi:hypothetical protein